MPDYSRDPDCHKKTVDSSAANSFVLDEIYMGVGYEMEYRMITTPILRFQYTIAGDRYLPKKLTHQLDWHWRKHQRRLERLPLEEREKHWIWSVICYFELA